MSGRISVDDAAFDGGARKLRSAKSGLASVQGQLNDGLAAGAPPAVSGQVRAAVASARAAVAGAQRRLETRAAELTRRAVATRVANGEGTERDYAAMLKWGPTAGPGPGRSLEDRLRALGELGLVVPDYTPGGQPVPMKDWMGGSEKLLLKWAEIWNTHTFMRKPGVKALGISRRKAVLSSQVNWANLNREIKSHQALVSKLNRFAQPLGPAGKVIDVISVVSAKGTRERTTAIGAAGGGMAGLAVGAKGGAAIGLMVGGPMGAIIGAGLGGAIGATIGGALGKKIANWKPVRAVADTISDGIDGGKKAVSSATSNVKKAWKKLF